VVPTRLDRDVELSIVKLHLATVTNTEGRDGGREPKSE
jgi:hypothetical protein